MQFNDDSELPKIRKRDRNWEVQDVFARCKIDGDCLLWTKAASRGLPTANINGKQVMVKRWVWEQTKGYIVPREKGKKACIVSICGNSLCCNPEHLKRENFSNLHKKSWSDKPIRKVKAGIRMRKIFEGKGRAIINFEIAQEIRQNNRSAKELAKEYGVTISAIYAVRSGKTWKNHLMPSSIFNIGAAKLSFCEEEPRKGKK